MYYKISGNRMWDTENAAFIQAVPSNSRVVELSINGELCDETYLRKTLRFYGYKVGPELMTIKELQEQKIAEVVDQYETALTATLTMPTASPSPLEVMLAAIDFEREDSEGLAFVRAHLTAVRDSLIQEIYLTQTANDIQSILIKFPV